jgi:hypothetical protein
MSPLKTYTAVLLALSGVIVMRSDSSASQPPYMNMPMYYIWYWTDPEKHTTGWNGGVLETPLVGYYDSRDPQVQLRALRTLAEWGINVACLSWWGPHQDAIIDAVASAARELRREGFNIWLTCYIEQDFNYDDLPSNSKPGAMLRHALERYYLRYPDVFATIGGKPFMVIYGRCGLPVLPVNHERFRSHLRARYGATASLNSKCRTRFKDFDSIAHDPRAGGLFFDHVKARYNDSVHRIPGFIYPAEPHMFDRWFVNALLHHADKVQQPSWNEFWEGSNIEPTHEYGKHWVQKNELYTSILRECVSSMRQADLRSPLAVILNEWAPFYMREPANDLWGIVNSLRRLGVDFVLLPESEVNSQNLRAFRVVIAPSCGVGFGLNSLGQPIEEVLRKWISTGKERRLFATRSPRLASSLGVALKEAEPTAPLRLLIDLGAENDERYIGGGWRGREDWGKRGKDIPGVSQRTTIRWTILKRSTLSFRIAPKHDYALTLYAHWHYPCAGRILVNDIEVGRFDEKPGVRMLRFNLPAKIVGESGDCNLDIVHDSLWAPAEVGRGDDPSTLGIAVDGVDIAASGHEEDPIKAPSAETRVRFLAPLFGAPAQTVKQIDAGETRDRIEAPNGRLLARYADGQPKYLLLRIGQNELLYDNGLTGTWVGPSEMASLLGRWAKLKAADAKASGDIFSTTLHAGNTDIIVASNRAAKPASIELPLKAENGLPVVSVLRLAHDGHSFVDISREAVARKRLRQAIRHYGVFQIARSPVSLWTPDIRLAPSEDRCVAAMLFNWTARPQKGAIWVEGPPSIRCSRVSFSLKPRGKAWVELTLRCGEFLDWGRRTLVFKIKTSAGIACFWKPARALKPADLILSRKAFHVPEQGRDIELSLSNRGESTARKAAIEIGGSTVSFDDIEIGAASSRRVRLSPAPQPYECRIIFFQGNRKVESVVPVVVAPLGPTGATTVTNPLPVERVAVVPIELPASMPQPLREPIMLTDGTENFPVTSVMGAHGLVKLGPYQTRYLSIAAPQQKPAAEGFQVSSSDLGTGRGTAAVSTPHFSLVWDEALGGTLRCFILSNGRDYGAGSFGVEYRLGDRIVEQTSRPGKLSVWRDEFGAAVHCQWSDERISVGQSWFIRATEPYIELGVEVRPYSLDRTVVAILNADLRRNDLRRIYPGFTTLGEASGWTPDRKELHFGWKEYWGPYTPDAWVAYSQDANNVQEAIAIIPRSRGAISGFRQGFYPQRPAGLPPAVDSHLAAPAAPSYQAVPPYQPGTADKCEIELYRTVGNSAAFDSRFVIYTFSGRWDAFKDFIALLDNQPLVSFAYQQEGR